MKRRGREGDTKRLLCCSVFSWRFFSPWILASLTSILVWIKDGCGSSSLQKIIAGRVENWEEGERVRMIRPVLTHVSLVCHACNAILALARRLFLQKH